MGTLYIVGTPIGNLEDITKRAIRILSEVDLILCEDTRTTKTLLEHYNIKTSLLSYHQHSKIKKIDYIIQLLREGKSLALVSDAGTPGISDPGSILVQEVTKSLSDSVKIVPIPGPTAETAIASVSGFPVNRFVFLGFPPIKNKRKKFFEEVAASKYPAIFYESPYRIIKTLQELDSLAGELEVVVGRELTKKFETIYRGKIAEVIKKIEEDVIKGEFVVIVKSR